MEKTRMIAIYKTAKWYAIASSNMLGRSKIIHPAKGW